MISLKFFQSFIAFMKELIFVTKNDKINEITERFAHAVIAAGSEITEETPGKNFFPVSLNFFPDFG